MDKGPKDKNHDDDSVDEKGNIRGLIDYDYESDDSELSFTSSELRILKKTGKLPEKLRKDIQKGRVAKKKSTRSSSDSTWSEPPKKSRRLSKRIEEEEEEEDEDDEEDEDEEEEEEEEEEPVKKKKSRTRRGFKPRTRRPVKEETEEEEEEEEEEDSETLDSDEEEEEDDEDDSDYEEEEAASAFKGISISFGGGDDPSVDHMIPKRHNMKKESEVVRKFVKLVTKPVEQETIDDQIDQFKGMESSQQKTLIEALEKRSDYVKKEQPLMFRLLQMKLAPDTMAIVMQKYNALNTMDPSSGEYYKLRSWMEKLVSIPLGVYREMPVRLEEGSDACKVFMDKATRCLNDAIYGQDDAKLQILQFIASKISNPTASGLSLLLLGPPGIGKTSLIKNGIAKALEWPFQFISLGGDSDSTTYTGHQFVYEGSHSGKIANCLAQAKSMSTIMMFDELDKISATPKGEEVQNLLVHLTDPVQNMDFEDKYLSGIPLDLSRAMFVFSGNDINKIDRILLDRMVVVRLAGYESKDKIAIAEQYLLPAALKEVNLVEKVAICRDVIQHILENYAKEENGVRELKRCLEQIAQRVNMLRMFNVKELPFHIPGFTLPFVLKKEHVDLFLKKKDTSDKPPMGMYT
jgi:ATP-dependent Lon protease